MFVTKFAIYPDQVGEQRHCRLNRQSLKPSKFSNFQRNTSEYCIFAYRCRSRART